MRIDAASRSVALGVGELAAFSPYPRPGAGGLSGLWRAQAGQRWHADLQRGEPDFQAEAPIAGSLRWRGWTLELSGRIDQLRDTETGGVEAREIKTVAQPLPMDRETLRERYPSYLVQLLLYRELLQRVRQLPPEAIALRLLLVELDTGLRQVVEASESDAFLLAALLERFVDYLEARAQRLAALQRIDSKIAFPEPRPGQETIQADLADAFARASLVCLEAPTGYGKTAVAWAWAINELAQGRGQRVLYLTSKGTGQLGAVRELERIVGSDASLGVARIRSKAEHCINHEFRCLPSACAYLADFDKKWRRSGLQRLYSMSDEWLTVERLKEEGRACGLCPYEIMRAGLGFRDVWVGDLNYVFSPRSRALLEGQPDYDPAQTLLIVDEAHNLPERAGGNYSLQLELAPLQRALASIEDGGSPPRLRNALSCLASLLASLPPTDELDPRLEDELRDLLADASQALRDGGLDPDAIDAQTAELLWDLAGAHASLTESGLPFLFCAPRPGAVQMACLDAAKAVARDLAPFARTLMLSATLSPFDSFVRRCGLDEADPPPVRLRPPAPWRDEAYRMAADVRVDTRYKSRAQHMDTTADTMAALCESETPLAVFFPSYAYARQAVERFHARHPQFRAAAQPQTGSLAEQQSFIEESLALADALVLILGGRFAEGVDMLGGRVALAMVVGPALPEVNALQRARTALAKRSGVDPFRTVYLEPGLLRVNQALGRLARAPGQRVRVLLHCRRFAERQAKELLDPAYRLAEPVRDWDELRRWLEATAPSPF